MYFIARKITILIKRLNHLDTPKDNGDASKSEGMNYNKIQDQDCVETRHAGLNSNSI